MRGAACRFRRPRPEKQWCCKSESSCIGRSGQGEQVIQLPLLSFRHHPGSKALVFISVSSSVAFCEPRFVLVCSSLMCPRVMDYLLFSVLPLSRIHSLIQVLQLPCLWLFRPHSLSACSKYCDDILLSCPFPSLSGFPGPRTGKLSRRGHSLFCCPLAACCHRNLPTC